jgi:hypothetical protein
MIVDHQLASPKGSSSGGRFDSGLVAHVSFRVQCATLGHGEEVFLIRGDDMVRHKVRLHFRTLHSFSQNRRDSPLCLLVVFQSLFPYIRQQLPFLGIKH